MSIQLPQATAEPLVIFLGTCKSTAEVLFYDKKGKEKNSTSSYKQTNSIT